MFKLIACCYVFFFYVVTANAQNLLNVQEWIPGTGGTVSFTVNGSTTENSREWGTAPDGSRAVLWKASPLGDINGDGGWHTAAVGINKQMMYRFTVWLKKTNSTSGQGYFGCSNAISVVTHLNGTANNNPYFWSGVLPKLDRWYLLVGYVHGLEDSSTINFGGIYDGVTGTKVATCTDFKFTSTASTIYHRSYLYYARDTNDRQYFYAPRLEMVNGNEPSVATLLNTAGNGLGTGYPAVLGVGTSNIPSGYKLAIGGKAIAEEIKVKLQSSGWPDYVFDSCYQLTSLAETERFIKSNKHLPGIPSATEIGEEGVNLGANQALLLKKIEELTLYMIDLKKENDGLKNKVAAMDRSMSKKAKK